MKIQIILVLSCLTLQAFSAKSKYNEDGEDNPYEFGFQVDGQQHRHEKKDVNGIIQGEFGFITADGIYHVTVYATDEDGNFKILSMRNIRVSGPLDEPNAKLPDTSQFGKENAKPLPNPLAIAPAQPPAASSAVKTTTTRPYGEFTTQPTIKPACAGCGYVTTQKNDGKPGKLPFQTPAFQNPKPGTVVIGEKPNPQNDVPFNTGILPGQQGGNGFPSSLPQTPFQQGGNGFPSSVPQSPFQQGGNGFPSSIPQSPFQQGGNGFPSNSPQIPSLQGGNGFSSPQINQQINQGVSSVLPQNPSQQGLVPIPPPGNPQVNKPSFQPKPNPLGIGNGNNYDTPSNGITVANNVINVPNNDPIPIQDKYPGMVDGLPPGITKDDITDLLYKFNYTVGFHGHYEKGYKNGAKVGGYFVNDRDGVSRIVTYVADENGYRPKVKFIRLDLNSDLVPKEGSEKKFGLKNFEFVWYPLK